MTQVIPEQQLDLAHIKAALGKFARESGFTYKKNVQLTASLLEFHQKCLVFVPGIVYPAIVIPVRAPRRKVQRRNFFDIYFSQRGIQPHQQQQIFQL